jgi:hypothetical protein
MGIIKVGHFGLDLRQYSENPEECQGVFSQKSGAFGPLYPHPLRCLKNKEATSISMSKYTIKRGRITSLQPDSQAYT